MSEYTRYVASFFSTGLRFAVIASLILLSGCGDNSKPADEVKPPDEVIDQCPVDDTKIEEGLCGCGVPDTDTDSDGTPDCLDACPEDSDTIPDEFGFCGDTSDAATVAEGEALTLAVNGAVLTILANTLVPGTTVSLAEVDAGLLSELPDGSDENRVTPIYALEFGTAQLARNRMSFALDVPATSGSLSYTRIQIEGGLGTEGRSNTGWLPNLGRYDETQSLLVIELGATATRFLIAGLVRVSATTLAVAASATGGEQKTPDLMKARASAIQAAAFSEEPAWAQHGWIILCDPEDFKQFNDDRCDPEAPGFEEMMGSLGSQLYSNDSILTDLRFPRGRVTRLNYEPEFTWLTYDPLDRSTITAAASGGLPEYFLAWADPDTTPKVLGAYYPSLELLEIDVDLAHGKGSETAIHELMHAVQRIEITDVWKEAWIIEGLASAIEPNSSGYSGPTGTDYRFGTWRDWKHLLTGEENKDAYEVLEFWLSLTGDMSRIPRLYEWLRGNASSAEANSQLRVDEALTAMSLPPLGEAYTNLILTRDGQTDYPHCADEELTAPRICSGQSCSTSVEDVQPFSAHCLAEIIEFDTCNDEPAEISVMLEPGSPNPNMKLILRGTVYDANTPVDFPIEGGRLWVINTDLESAIMSPGPTAELVFKNESSCDNPYMSMVSQRIHSGGNAVASESMFNLVSPGRDISARVYESYEDLSQGSVISTLDNSGRWTDVSVPPLGEAEWVSAHSLSAFGQKSVELPVSTATVDTFNSTVTVIDATSMTISGVQTATATRTENAGRATATNSSNYKLATKDVPAVLTVSWGCDMSNVSVSSVTPDPVGPESLLVISNPLNPNNNWECAPRSWTIAADATVFVRISTSYQIYNDDDSAQYRNGGGAFEIHLQAIIPD